MTYVIAEPCIGEKNGACVDVCPAACIHTTPDSPQHYIDPAICIECEQCVLVCPVNAIFLDKELPGEWTGYTEINARFFLENKPVEDVPVRTAEQMVHAVASYASHHGLAVAAVVVGRAGNVLASLRMSGASPEVHEQAEKKAYTAALYRVPTNELRAGGRQGWLSESDAPVDQSRVLMAPGGHPLVDAGDIVGAVGIAGAGSREQDVLCCQAALGAFLGPAH